MRIPVTLTELNSFAGGLKEWWKNNRRIFSWRKMNLSPYQSLILEYLLWKTRAEMVEGIFSSFLAKYHSIEALKRASLEQLEQDLEPLGLWERRASLLKRVASTVSREFGGKIPTQEGALLRLPGVGQYLASAILCFSRGEPIIPVDVNVRRVIERTFGISFGEARKLSSELRSMLRSLAITWGNAREATWAIIDFAAKVCRPRPLCDSCPLKEMCFYARTKRARSGASLDHSLAA